MFWDMFYGPGLENCNIAIVLFGRKNLLMVHIFLLTLANVCLLSFKAGIFCTCLCWSTHWRGFLPSHKLADHSCEMLIPFPVSLPSLSLDSKSVLTLALFPNGLEAPAVSRPSGFKKILLSLFNGGGVAFSGRRVRSRRGSTDLHE